MPMLPAKKHTSTYPSQSLRASRLEPHCGNITRAELSTVGHESKHSADSLLVAQSNMLALERE